MIEKNSEENEDYLNLYNNLNQTISELNEYFDELLNELNQINEKTNSTKDLTKLVADMRTKVDLLSSTTLNEEE